MLRGWNRGGQQVGMVMRVADEVAEQSDEMQASITKPLGL